MEHNDLKSKSPRFDALLKKIRSGLSFKLLVLTAIFVLVAEILIFVPSVANFRNGWLKDHLLTAEAASIVYLDTGDLMLSEAAGQNLLVTTNSIAVAIRRDGVSRLMATKSRPSSIMEVIDLDNTTVLNSITGALSMLIAEPDEQYRVFGKMRSGPAIMELVQEVRHIQKAMWIYARNVAILSLLISVFTAGLVYFALYRLIVKPIIRISSNMDAFSRQPENVSLVYKPGNRSDEIGLAEDRLASLQMDLQNTLRQKKRLADLGLAVSKINHDLRNILASAQLFSDRLSALPDPMVQRFAPKLIRTIDRAADYTKSVLDYGKAMEAPPKRRNLLLNTTANDVADLLGLESSLVIDWQNDIPLDFQVHADPEQLFRVMMNLCRNAQQAMVDADIVGREKVLNVSAEQVNDTVEIRVSDTGPGIPEHVRENIFSAFQGSTKVGGSGLGLAIAIELLRAHGGTIDIEKTDEKGTTFLISLPQAKLET